MTPANDLTEPALPAVDRHWKEIVAPYQIPSARRGIVQIANTLLPYLALWVAMYFARTISWWLVVPLAALAAGFLVRLFIIHHDCGHGSFFRSRQANDTIGYVTGILTFTPYHHWRWEHALHHATSGDLDRRGTGDIWTLTVQEYLESSRWRRFAYRLARNPVILFVIAPLYLFLIQHRFARENASRRERDSVFWTNLGLAGVAAGASAIFGVKGYVLIQFMILLFSGAAGVWLFYVQHQFDGVYWERSGEWDYVRAALQGSSFYKLPKVLQWFSGNIGFHHIHHLSSRIPNYHLEKCHESEPLFQSVRPVTLVESLRSFTFRLWDEQRRRLVGYDHVRALRREQRQARRQPPTRNVTEPA